MLTVLLGGARSGKSTLALDMARRGGSSVTFLATSPTIPGDADLAGRIARHRAERPAAWTTIEEQLDLAGAIRSVETDVLVIDCLTLWVANMQHHRSSSLTIDVATDAALAALRSRDLVTIVVSNEVGLGIVPDNELSRTYRDLLGRVNQRWVAAADHALLMVAGKAIALADPHELLR